MTMNNRLNREARLNRPRPQRTTRRPGQMAEVKRALVREFGQGLAGHEPMLQAAMREAEALAWQTPYPCLLFPLLAEEKVAGVRRWLTRQKAIRRSSPSIWLAA